MIRPLLITGVCAGAVRQSPSRPSVAEVFTHCADRIHQAAARLWPDEDVVLDGHVPSATGYVHRAHIGGRTLYAKTSVLGVSLVSLLRGARGPWATVRKAQQEYARQPDSLLVREAAQLRFLAGLEAPQVCAIVGFRDGVIFTEAVTGPTLADLLLDRPGDAAGLLSRALAELAPLHRPGAARRLDEAWVISERSIDGTFRRKFDGPAGAAYVDQLGEERCPGQRLEIAELVRDSVPRLLGLREKLPSSTGTSLAYGDLKPEHVLFPDGPDARPVFLDPGLRRATEMVDAAKLLSRTVLLIAARRPEPVTVRLVVDGLALVARTQTKHMSLKEQRAWLRHLLVLWLMDTLNIVTTYLSAPAALPLPRLGLDLIDRAVPVCRLVDAVSADLIDPLFRRGRSERTLARITEVAR